jgi:uncharacterized repeat protein (TIGR02543 family)
MGWYKDASFSVQMSAGQTISSNTTLYAKWTFEPTTLQVGDILPPNLTLTFNTDIVPDTMDRCYIKFGTGSNYLFQNFLQQDVICYPDVIAYDYSLTQWAQSEIIMDLSSFSEAERTVTEVQSTDIVFYNFAIETAGYSITYEENGGTSQTDLTNQTALPSTLPTPTKTNNIFIGWYYDGSFTQKAYANDALSSNVTLYAKWYDLSIRKAYKGSNEVSSQYEKIYKGTTLIYNKSGLS